MKTWQYVRLCIFTLVGILTIVFYRTLYHYVNDIVGAVMVVYGIEEICFALCGFVENRDKEDITSGSILTVLGLVVLVLLKGDENFESACVIWAVWAILREGKEMSRIVKRIYEKRPFILNAIESFLSIVLSVLLILEPREHAHMHLILLGIELISKVWFEYLDYIYDKRKGKSKSTQTK